MRSLTQYEVAWNMYRAGSAINIICKTVSKHRATIYRWLKDIKLIGIREFLKRKKTSKHRRPKARVPEHIRQLVVDIRIAYNWCGQKIKKELVANYNIKLGLTTIYRILHERFQRSVVGVHKYQKHQAIVVANAPREVVEHDTVDLGGGVYAYTSIDIFSKEPVIVIGADLTMETGAIAFRKQKEFYGHVETHQSDGGSEFQTSFKEAVLASGSKHRYSRPYKKNEQAHIENFNKSLRSECFPRGDYSQKDIVKLQKRADEYTHHYIHRRWHMGLPDNMTPAEFKVYYAQQQTEQQSNATITITVI